MKSINHSPPPSHTHSCILFAGSECDYEVASLSGSMSTFHTLVMPSTSPQPTSVSPSLTVQQTTDNNVSGRKQVSIRSVDVVRVHGTYKGLADTVHEWTV